MTCVKCGTVFADGTNVCPTCGTVYQVAQAPVQQAPVQQAPVQQVPVQQVPVQQVPVQQVPVQPVTPAAPVAPINDTPILVLGILSLVFFYVPVAGIVLAAIAIAKAGKIVKAGQPLLGKGKAGKILGIIGLVFSIICNVYYIACVLMAIFGMAAVGSLAYMY